MKNIVVPTRTAEDWQRLLAGRDRQGRDDPSAKALARCWQDADGFPPEIRTALHDSGVRLFRDVELLLAIPEHQVAMPPFNTYPSQNDIFVLAKGEGQLISIAVEGKYSEPFGPFVAKWTERMTEGKRERLRFLSKELGLGQSAIGHIRYQLLHRTASALLEARRFRAENAMMLVHSFSQCNEWFDDFCDFCELFGLLGRVNSAVGPKHIKGIDLYLSWVRGNPKYLRR